MRSRKETRTPRAAPTIAAFMKSSAAGAGISNSVAAAHGSPQRGQQGPTGPTSGVAYSYAQVEQIKDGTIALADGRSGESRFIRTASAILVPNRRTRAGSSGPDLYSYRTPGRFRTVFQLFERQGPTQCCWVEDQLAGSDVPAPEVGPDQKG